jgi:hypothetical protein
MNSLTRGLKLFNRKKSVLNVARQLYFVIAIALVVALQLSCTTFAHNVMNIFKTMETINALLNKEPNINDVFHTLGEQIKKANMKTLKPIQVLTPEGIYLLERVKIHLESYNIILPNESSTGVIAELTELINELKTE